MAKAIAPRISLPHNFEADDSPESMRLKLGELVRRLEDHLNGQVAVHLFTAKNQKRPTFNQGDIIFDFTSNRGFATLQQWDGVKLVPLSLAAASIIGLINLLTQGTGSGTDSTMYLRSDGANGWVLAPVAAGSGGGGGPKFTYSNVTAVGDAPAGFIRFDNTALDLATTFKINAVDADTNNLGNWTHSWDLSTSARRAYVFVVKDGAPNPIAIFAVTGAGSKAFVLGVPVAATYPISWIAGNTSFTNNDNFRIFLAPAGDVGGSTLITVGGTQDGVNTTFALTPYAIGTVLVFLNGQLLKSGTDYALTTSSQLDFLAPTIPVAGDIITVIGYAGLAPLAIRNSFDLLSTPLAPNAQSTGTIFVLGKTVDIIKVISGTLAPVRVRLYSSVAGRTADLTRNRYTPPTAGAQHQVIMDLVLTLNTGYTWIMSPIARGSNAAGLTEIYYTLDNLDTSIRNLQLSLIYLTNES